MPAQNKTKKEKIISWDLILRRNSYRQFYGLKGGANTSIQLILYSALASGSVFPSNLFIYLYCRLDFKIDEQKERSHNFLRLIIEKKQLSAIFFYSEKIFYLLVRE